MSTKNEVLRFMRMAASDHLDCGEVNTTWLAEAACDHFDAYGPSPNFSIPDNYFELAYEAAVWFEKQA